MMHHIRPWKLFELVEERDAWDRVVRMKLPLRRITKFADYSLRVLELSALAAAIRIVKAERIFEFGTFCGNSTFHMALASPVGAKIWTLDADEETLERAGLAELYKWREDFKLEFEGTPVEKKITRLWGDSRRFDYKPFAKSMDLILIDADHSYSMVCNDTQAALSMLTNFGVILWHDYQNHGASGNTYFLDELATSSDLFHLEDTLLCFQFADQNMTERLKEMR